MPLRRRAALPACAVAVVSSLARPDSACATDATKKNAITHEPLAITSRGVQVQYERLVLPPLSAAAGLGFRSAARGDFASSTWTLHLESRYYLTGHEYGSDTRGLVGPFVGLGVNLARTSLEHRAEDRHIGTMITLEESLRLGFRVVALGVQELSLALTAAVIHEFDLQGRLAPNTRVAPGAVLTVGWVF